MHLLTACLPVILPLLILQMKHLITYRSIKIRGTRCLLAVSHLAEGLGALGSPCQGPHPTTGLLPVTSSSPEAPPPDTIALGGGQGVHIGIWGGYKYSVFNKTACLLCYSVVSFWFRFYFSSSSYILLVPASLN